MLKDALPFVAILVSLGALYIAILNYERDRAILQVSASASIPREEGSARLEVTIVNVGRRPIVIDAWVGIEKDLQRIRGTGGGIWSGRCVHSMEALSLPERQTHTFNLQMSDLDFELPNGGSGTFDDMWVEDTLGHKHTIHGIREAIKKLREWTALQTPSHNAEL